MRPVRSKEDFIAFDAPYKNTPMWVVDHFTWKECYERGYREPRYPVPAIPIRVGWMPSGICEFVNRPYWYVSTRTYLWTFWKGLGLLEERV